MPKWVKGQSGNPRGRPSQTPLTDELRKQLYQTTLNGKTTHLAMIVAEAIERAEVGDMSALRLIWEYMDGKAPQPQEVGGPGGGPIVVRVEYGDDPDTPPA